MNDEAEEKRVKRAKRTARKRSFVRSLFMIIISIGMIIFMKMTFVLFIVGLLPSIVANYIDHSPSRSLYHSVLACNLSGVLPFLAELFITGNETRAMQMMLGDVEVLFLMYLSAAFGWILFYGCPFIARFVISTINQRKISMLHAKQKRLIIEWGDGIAQMQNEMH